MPDPLYYPSTDEPIYHAVCAWIVQWRSRARCPAWPAVDPDAEESGQELERTLPRVWVPEHLFGPWEVHQRYLG